MQGVALQNKNFLPPCTCPPAQSGPLHVLAQLGPLPEPEAEKDGQKADQINATDATNVYFH